MSRQTPLCLVLSQNPVKYKTKWWMFPHYPKINISRKKIRSGTVFFTLRTCGLICRNLDITYWSKGDAGTWRELGAWSCLDIFRCTERNMSLDWDGNLVRFHLLNKYFTNRPIHFYFLIFQLLITWFSLYCQPQRNQTQKKPTVTVYTRAEKLDLLDLCCSGPTWKALSIAI